MELRVKKGGAGWVLALYFALKPIYLWESGSLQISDLLLVLFMAFMIFRDRGRIRFDRKSKPVAGFLMLLVFYQFAVNCIWFFITRHVSLLKSSTYYIFNAFAFIATLSVCARDGVEKIKKAVAKGCVVSMILTILGLALATGGSRGVGFFNNPNQLGYYAIIILSLWMYFHEEFNVLQGGILLFGACWAIIASISKAAIIGAFGLFIVYLLFYRKKNTLSRLLLRIAALTLVFGIIYLLFFSESKFVLNNHTLATVRRRILYMSQENDSNLGTGRGYLRILELKHNFLWGMGEGANYRFTIKTNGEIHSTFASLLVSYGLLGFAAYVLFFIKCVVHRGCTARNLAVLSGVLFYSVTHNGIRNTLVWIILAVMLMDRGEQKPVLAEEAVSPAPKETIGPEEMSRPEEMSGPEGEDLWTID